MDAQGRDKMLKSTGTNEHLCMKCQRVINNLGH